MRTYLCVAHRTLVGEHLLTYARWLAREDFTRFHLVVPVRIPDHIWSEGEIRAEARCRLLEGLRTFSGAGLWVSGEIGDANPVYAVSTALRRLGRDCDGILLSTLPAGFSAWLRMDIMSRMRREFDLPVVHLVAEPAPVPG